MRVSGWINMPKKTETKEVMKNKLQQCTDSLAKKDAVIEELEKKIKSLDESIKGYNDKLLRMQADFENYQKVIQRGEDEFIKSANRKLILDLLDDLENLELALEKSSVKDQFYNAVSGITQHLWNTLTRFGVKKIDTKNKRFDPFYHEVIATEEGDGEDGTIIEEYKRGYLLYDSLLKPAKVKVLKKR